MSSVILAFAFMIGSASAKYFEGVLFILGRRPYGIGDIIHVSSVDHDITTTGAKGWRVQHVSLFETSFTWVATNESATVSNGSLASSRIINWARSPNPRFNIHYVVPIETNYETLELFKLAIEEYVKVCGIDDTMLCQRWVSSTDSVLLHKGSPSRMARIQCFSSRWCLRR